MNKKHFSFHFSLSTPLASWRGVGGEAFFLFTFLFSLFILVGCATSGLTKEERLAQTRQHVAECLAARTFKIDIRDMQTLRYGNRFLTSVWNVEVRNDSLISYLPYLGNAYSVNPYGGSNSKGLNFSERIQSYKQERNNRKERTTLTLNVENDEDRYTYLIEIYDNGSSTVSVRSYNRDFISFTGELE